MSTQVATRANFQTLFLGLLTLLLGAACGYALLLSARPAAPEPALLWDDYIVATAALYQRDGDLEGAKERLGKLGTTDPGQSVAALAAVHTAPADAGAAVRNLALALTGRAIAAPAASAAVTTTASAVAGWQMLVRGPVLWAGLCVLGLAWLFLSVRNVGSRRATRAKFASVPQLPVDEGREESATAALEGMPLAPTMPSADTARSSRAAPTSLALTLTYQASDEPYEQMMPINDPLSQRMVGGCGLATGPQPTGGGTGHLAVLVWLHDASSGGQPETLGLVAAPATGAAEVALQEWMAFSHLQELAVARTGASWSFETERLQASIYITDIGSIAKGRSREVVITRLRAHVEITFRGRSSALRDLKFSSPVGSSPARR